MSPTETGKLRHRPVTVGEGGRALRNTLAPCQTVTDFLMENGKWVQVLYPNRCTVHTTHPLGANGAFVDCNNVELEGRYCKKGHQAGRRRRNISCATRTRDGDALPG